MRECNADWKVFIEIQVTEAYLRDLLQRHRSRLKGQSVIIVV